MIMQRKNIYVYIIKQLAKHFSEEKHNEITYYVDLLNINNKLSIFHESGKSYLYL